MDKLIELCRNLNIEVERSLEGKFGRFYEMLVEKNKVMNLTAITDKDDVIVKHFVDSLSVVPVLNELYPGGLGNLKILDLGTGAGFPGIPLKLVLPECEFVLLDSVNKKLNFVNDVIDDLGLSGISTVHGRAEDFAFDKGFRESFDLCLSRAVANLSTLSEYCLPYVKMDGYFISYKAGDCEEEINNSKHAIKLLGGKIVKVHNFILPGSDNERSLICIKKICSTDKKYPRKAGTPGKDPL